MINTTRSPYVHGTSMRIPLDAIEKIAANTKVITAILILHFIEFYILNHI